MYIQSTGLYISEVICSEINPIKKMITDALNNSMLMFVNRCWVTNVYT